MSVESTSPVRHAVILAGGAGTRLKPLTDRTPKPLVEFATEPFLYGVIRRLWHVGVTDVWLLTGSDTAAFKPLTQFAATHGVRVTAVTESEPLGTAGGVQAIADTFHAPFFVLNGDILTDVDFRHVATAHVTHGAAASLVVAPVDDPSAYGVCEVNGDGSIVRFLEKPSFEQCAGPALVNAGTYVIEPSLMHGFPAGELSFERDVFPAAILRGDRLHAVESTAKWADLGTPKRFREGHRLVLDGTIRWPSVDALPETEPGVRVHPTAVIASDAVLNTPVMIAAGATVESQAVVGPHAVVGADVRVGARTTLSDTVVHAGALIGADCAITHTVIGPAVTLGDRVRAHDDTVIVNDLPAGVICPAGAR